MSLEMKKTLGLSVLLHICFFTAALLWSAQLFEGRGERPGERVLFVRLLKEKRAGAGEQAEIRGTSASITKIPELLNPLIKREESVRVSHSPELPAEEIFGEVSDTSEKPVIDTPKPEEQVSGNSYALPRPVEKVGDSVNVRQGGDGFYNDTIAGADGYEEKYETGRTGGAAPVDVIKTIRSAIERSKTYPLAARRRGTEGVVHVGFSISFEGKPEQVRIVRSSGSPVLDRATIDIVRRAAPFPYVETPLEVPVVFTLQ